MRILFICPNRESLGVGYLSACLENAGHKTEALIDPTLFYYNQLIPNRFLDRVFSYQNVILDEIKRKQIDLVAFTVFHDNFNWARSLAPKIKKIKNIPMLFGGLHPTLMPEETIRESFVDMICIGEGEEAIVELADSMEKGTIDYNIRNIWFKNNGKIIKNPVRPLLQDLDKIPFWNRKVFLACYSIAKKIYPTITTRNCPFSCSYCCNVSLKKLYKGKGKFLRRRNPSYVIKELKIAKEEYGIEKVIFYDQNFNYDANWLEEFSLLYKKEINLPFFCFVYPNANKKGISLLKSAGCKAVNLGIESVYERTRCEILNRYTPTENIVNTIKLLKEANIYISANVIFGLPSQTEQEKIDTAKFFIENKVDLPNICWLRYYPKSEIFTLAKNKNLLTASQIKKIEKRTHDKGISIGDTFEKRYMNLHNLITLSSIIPKNISLLILQRKYYRFFPPISPLILKFIVTRFFTFMIRVVQKKQPIQEMSFFKFYSFFILKKLNFSYRKLYKETLHIKNN